MHIDHRGQETHKAAQIAGRYSSPRIQFALRRTERRIDLRDPKAKSAVVALTYCTLWLLVPLPVLHLIPTHASPLLPLLRVSSYFCALLGLICFRALLAARAAQKRNYGEHRSWRIFSRAAAEHGRD